MASAAERGLLALLAAVDTVEAADENRTRPSCKRGREPEHAFTGGSVFICPPDSPDLNNSGGVEDGDETCRAQPVFKRASVGGPRLTPRNSIDRNYVPSTPMRQDLACGPGSGPIPPPCSAIRGSTTCGTFPPPLLTPAALLMSRRTSVDVCPAGLATALSNGLGLGSNSNGNTPPATPVYGSPAGTRTPAATCARNPPSPVNAAAAGAAAAPPPPPHGCRRSASLVGPAPSPLVYGGRMSRGSHGAASTGGDYPLPMFPPPPHGLSFTAPPPLPGALAYAYSFPTAHYTQPHHYAHHPLRGVYPHQQPPAPGTSAPAPASCGCSLPATSGEAAPTCSADGPSSCGDAAAATAIQSASCSPDRDKPADAPLLLLPPPASAATDADVAAAPPPASPLRASRGSPRPSVVDAAAAAAGLQATAQHAAQGAWQATQHAPRCFRRSTGGAPPGADSLVAVAEDGAEAEAERDGSNSPGPASVNECAAALPASPHHLQQACAAAGCAWRAAARQAAAAASGVAHAHAEALGSDSAAPLPLPLPQEQPLPGVAGQGGGGAAAGAFAEAPCGREWTAAAPAATSIGTHVLRLPDGRVVRTLSLPHGSRAAAAPGGGAAAATGPAYYGPPAYPPHAAHAPYPAAAGGPYGYVVRRRWSLAAAPQPAEADGEAAGAGGSTAPGAVPPARGPYYFAGPYPAHHAGFRPALGDAAPPPRGAPQHYAPPPPPPPYALPQRAHGHPAAAAAAPHGYAPYPYAAHGVTVVRYRRFSYSHGAGAASHGHAAAPPGMAAPSAAGGHEGPLPLPAWQAVRRASEAGAAAHPLAQAPSFEAATALAAPAAAPASIGVAAPGGVDAPRPAGMVAGMVARLNDLCLKL